MGETLLEDRPEDDLQPEDGFDNVRLFCTKTGEEVQGLMHRVQIMGNSVVIYDQDVTHVSRGRVLGIGSGGEYGSYLELSEPGFRQFPHGSSGLKGAAGRSFMSARTVFCDVLSIACRSPHTYEIQPQNTKKTSPSKDGTLDASTKLPLA